ncbi:NAD-dependent epimerase/dehydratase family protein [Acidimangrovimonas pyrenivorans]|uniref:NAD-dependent epimerase/dehydratase family protein n=1 Tax=Acidimangrovimonas pyrenivorans TaxID=2030798 RepID=A0ABV7AMQ5_9RHOB
MDIFLLGASGSIGTAVAAELVAAGHDVAGLSRSARADAVLRSQGVRPLRGDLRAPEAWAARAVTADAILHCAVTWSADMGAVDRTLVAALIAAAARAGRRPRLVYTGGCWLYGETGDTVATEETRFEPIPPFAWMVENGRRLLESGLPTAILHPAMVYQPGGGVFARFVAAARAGRPIEVWGSAGTRWPLVHRADLAVAYRLLAERPGLTGHFNASAQAGVPVGEIAAAIARHHRSPAGLAVRPRAEVLAEQGPQGAGPMLDQQMAGPRLRAACGWAPSVADFARSDALG